MIAASRVCTRVNNNRYSPSKNRGRGRRELSSYVLLFQRVRIYHLMGEGEAFRLARIAKHFSIPPYLNRVTLPHQRLTLDGLILLADRRADYPPLVLAKKLNRYKLVLRTRERTSLSLFLFFRAKKNPI